MNNRIFNYGYGKNLKKKIKLKILEHSICGLFKLCGNRLNMTCHVAYYRSQNNIMMRNLGLGVNYNYTLVHYLTVDIISDCFFDYLFYY